MLDQAREKATSLGLHTRDGSFIVEAELDHADKSEALQTIAEQSQAQTIYFAGDDLTDYPAIKLAHQHSELGVFVCSDKRPTPPDDVSFALSDIEQHLTFIKQLADSLGKWPRL